MAIAQLLAAAGISQTELARRLRDRGWPVDQSRVSKWVRGVEAPGALDIYVAIDEECGVPRGTILRRAGYVVDADTDTRSSISADPALTEEARAMLLTVYDSAVKLSMTAETPAKAAVSAHSA